MEAAFTLKPTHLPLYAAGSSGFCLNNSVASPPSSSSSSSSSFYGLRLQNGCMVARRAFYKGNIVQARASDSSTNRVVPYANYAVPLDNSGGSSFITRPLAEILRDMNKRVPEKVIKIKVDEHGNELKYIPWYHANRMLSFYAPGWSGEVRSITFSPDSRAVTVVYRVTIKGSDGEIFRESSGTASVDDKDYGDPVQKAEGMAFRRACARFGLGLYLYHEDEAQ